LLDSGVDIDVQNEVRGAFNVMLLIYGMETIIKIWRKIETYSTRWTFNNNSLKIVE